MSSELNLLLNFNQFPSLKLLSRFSDGKYHPIIKGKKNQVDDIFDLEFEQEIVGETVFNSLNLQSHGIEQLQDCLHQLATIVRSANWSAKHFSYFKKLLKWVDEARQISPELFNWIGIYFKESYLLNTNSTALVLGPYFGERTEHTRIGLDSGLCGLALREERVINMDDVTKDSRHIACSLKTRSELIIPLKDTSGKYIAELDIDSNQLSAFDHDLEKRVKKHCEYFPLLEF